MVMAEDGLNRALELARSKKKHLEEILSITQKQSEVLSADRSEQLLANIEERQKLIDAIKTLDEEFMHIFHDVKEQLGLPGCESGFENVNSRDNSLYIQLLAEIDEQKGLLKAIYTLEQENQKRVKLVIEEVKTKLSGINRAKRGYKAYKQPNRQAEGIFIDKRE